MSRITSSSTSDEVLQFIQSNCPGFLSRYGPEPFASLNGARLLELTLDNIGSTFPDMSEKDKEVLLSRIDYLANDLRAVTPPPSFERRLPVPSSYDITVPIDEDRFHSDYQRHFFSPKSTKNKPDSSASLLSSSAELPRILFELWRTTDAANDEFCSEAWLPDMKEFELKQETYRLALKRPVKLRDTRIVAGRKWFGSLSLIARFNRIDSQLEMYLIEAEDKLFSSNEEFNYYFVKVFCFSNGALSLFYESRRLPIGPSCRIEYGERITIRFSKASAEAPFGVQPLIFGGETPKTAATTTATNLVKRNPGIVTSELFSIMMRDTESVATGSPLSLYDLMVFASRRDISSLSPEMYRFESYLLPTHEVSALTGSQYTLRTASQIEALRSDEDYMRNHSQVVDLLCIGWGLNPEFKGGKWNIEQSWLLRHALVSCILLANTACAKRLLNLVKDLDYAKRVSMAENGFGEALFTLMGNEVEAKKFWESSKLLGGLKSPHLPPPRTPLGQLISGYI
jgi:hypothetical protein